MPPFRCATCVFFSRHRPSWSDHPQPRGQCRRHAPVLDKDQDGRLRTIWPTVHEDNYCGEHAEIEAVVGEQEPVRAAVLPTVESPPFQTGPAWRCINCKEVTVSPTEPQRCVVCQCREFARVGD